MGREHFLKEVEDKKEEKSTLRGEWVVGRGIKKRKGEKQQKGQKQQEKRLNNYNYNSIKEETKKEASLSSWIGRKFRGAERLLMFNWQALSEKKI